MPDIDQLLLQFLDVSPLHFPHTVFNLVQIRAVGAKGLLKCGVSRPRRLTVSQAQWARTLPCWKIKNLSQISRMTGSSFWVQMYLTAVSDSMLLGSAPWDKKLITRWDSERELFYDIVHALQNNNIYGSIAEVCSHAKIRLAVEFESSSE